jgi:tetratricopeptide (TPR) repeat protein
MELGKLAKNDKKYEEAINYFEESIRNTRKIRNNESAEVFYEMIKLYELTNNKAMYDETLGKCKALDSSTTSLYKKMCDEL